MPQRPVGAGLVVALIMLIVMSMSALALVRAVSTGTLVAGNFAFRQAALSSAETGSEAAIAWLNDHIALTDLYVDQPNAGYYAKLPDDLDITGNTYDTAKFAIDWDKDNCNARTSITCLTASPETSEDDAGQIVQYLIHRLCRSAGSPYDPAKREVRSARKKDNSATAQRVVLIRLPLFITGSLPAFADLGTLACSSKHSCIFNAITIAAFLGHHDHIFSIQRYCLLKFSSLLRCCCTC
jgi:hypothetical protein